MDAAVVPLQEFPARFATRPLYEEGFVMVARAGHPFHRKPSLENYCAAQHVVVSQTTDPTGFVDHILAGKGMSRRVALTVPNSMFALALLPDTDLICALPRSFVEAQGARFGVRASEPPFPMGRFPLNVVTPRVALKDPWIAWLVNTLANFRAKPKKPARAKRS
jgi:DNA-binding transcriptional LysR family regulator